MIHNGCACNKTTFKYLTYLEQYALIRIEHVLGCRETSQRFRNMNFLNFFSGNKKHIKK